MLKRHILKRILISTAALFAIFVIYLIPNNNDIYVSLDIKDDFKKEYVYLLNDNNLLGRASVYVTSENTNDLISELIDVLIIDGKKESSIPNGFRSILPSDTLLNGVIIDGNKAKLDFNFHLLDISEYLEMPMIESILYTITEIPSIDSIEISIDGVSLTKLPKSNINIPKVIDRDFGINKIYNITSLSGITKVVEYYVAKYNNNHYYVPVTKYINDSKDKIKIIIEDMVSSNLYEQSLMSYINSNTKLVNSTIEDDTMKLFFNNSIMNFDDNDILEEVIETISLSVKDNYDVSNLVFYVDDKEFYKSVIKSIE